MRQRRTLTRVSRSIESVCVPSHVQEKTIRYTPASRAPVIFEPCRQLVQPTRRSLSEASLVVYGAIAAKIYYPWAFQSSTATGERRRADSWPSANLPRMTTITTAADEKQFEGMSRAPWFVGVLYQAIRYNTTSFIVISHERMCGGGTGDGIWWVL